MYDFQHHVWPDPEKQTSPSQTVITKSFWGLSGGVDRVGPTAQHLALPNELRFNVGVG